MKKNFSIFLIVLLAVLLGWQALNHARLTIEVALAEEQTRNFEEMRQQAIQGSASGAAESLAYVVSYYPSGTKQREGSRLDKVVERMRTSAIRDIISQLRQKTGEDLGEKPGAWIEKYAKNK